MTTTTDTPDDAAGVDQQPDGAADPAAPVVATGDGMPTHTNEPPASPPSPQQTALALAIRQSIGQVEGALAEFDKVEAGLAALEAKHRNVVFDASTAKGRRDLEAARYDVRQPRFATEKARKGAKAPVLALGKNVDERARYIFDRIAPLEDNYTRQIDADDARRETERKAKERAALERVAALRARIDELHALARGVLGKPSADIEAAIREVVAREPGDDFAELKPEAVRVHADALAALRQMLDAAKAHEAEAAAVAAQRAELEAQRAAREAADALAALIDRATDAPASTVESCIRELDASTIPAAAADAARAARVRLMALLERAVEREARERQDAERAEQQRVERERLEAERRRTELDDAEVRRLGVMASDCIGQSAVFIADELARLDREATEPQPVPGWSRRVLEARDDTRARIVALHASAVERERVEAAGRAEREAEQRRLDEQRQSQQAEQQRLEQQRVEQQRRTIGDALTSAERRLGVPMSTEKPGHRLPNHPRVLAVLHRYRPEGADVPADTVDALVAELDALEPAPPPPPLVAPAAPAAAPASMFGEHPADGIDRSPAPPPAANAGAARAFGDPHDDIDERHAEERERQSRVDVDVDFSGLQRAADAIVLQLADARSALREALSMVERFSKRRQDAAGVMARVAELRALGGLA